MDTREMTKRYRLSQWAKNFQERNENGETIAGFCIRKGISKDKYYYWLRRVRMATSEQLNEECSKQQTALAVQGFTEVRVSEPPVSAGTTGSGHICIETGSCKVTAGSKYPAEVLVTILRELVTSC